MKTNGLWCAVSVFWLLLSELYLKKTVLQKWTTVLQKWTALNWSHWIAEDELLEKISWIWDEMRDTLVTSLPKFSPTRVHDSPSEKNTRILLLFFHYFYTALRREVLCWALLLKYFTRICFKSSFTTSPENYQPRMRNLPADGSVLISLNEDLSNNQALPEYSTPENTPISRKPMKPNKEIV